MRQKITERLKLLEEKREEVKHEIADWNLMQFDTAIWYLKWILDMLEDYIPKTELKEKLLELTQGLDLYFDNNSEYYQGYVDAFRELSDIYGIKLTEQATEEQE